ncbi:sulfotransferase [uncultured Winogradskyella sp.]|uniref:sulfotransferase n=1 Tax=uncultured Winogradskyella sp. TaxID=395353 RepID=UPI002626F182|nr:sulfotransferase [uncultured Winogradskyella sp.]
MTQIFILGVGRTGSKFYMQLLNTHKDIFISPELIFRHPVKKDFYTLINDAIKAEESLESIVDKLFNFKERLPYIKTIQKIGKAKLTDALSRLNELTPYAIFDCIIHLSAEVEGKTIYGAKFPIHYKYSQELIEFYKESKIFYLTRDPRAIYASDIRKKRKEQKTEYYRFKVKYFLRFFVLFYTIFEWRMSLRIYEKCKNKFSNNAIKLMKYENIIADNNSVIKEIALFINCNAKDFNLEKVKIVDSSYEKGISANRWRANINGLEKLIFKLFVGNKMKKYGYK